MKPTEEQSIAENLNKALDEMQKVVKQFNLARERNESEQPKFAVGERYKYNEILHSSSKCYDEKPCTLLSIIGEDAYWVKVMFDDGRKATIRYDELSPLPEMYVGRKWVLEQEGHECNGYKMKCIDKCCEFGSYEWRYNPVLKCCLKHVPYSYSSFEFKVICIDPTFWMGEICGEQVRVYTGDDNWLRVLNKHGAVMSVSPNNSLSDKLWLAAIKDANIPIMPHSQSDGNYLPPEEK